MLVFARHKTFPRYHAKSWCVCVCVKCVAAASFFWQKDVEGVFQRTERPHELELEVHAPCSLDYLFGVV